jgi:hypothetical protein
MKHIVRKYFFYNITMSFLLALSVSAVFGQSQPHKVLYCSQSNIQTGIELKYPINLTKGSVLYLENKNHKIIALNGPNSFSRKDAEKLYAYESGLSKNYFSYVLKKMTANDAAAQNSFGGVSRGQGYLSAVNPLPGETIVDDTIRFVWKSKPLTSGYFFNLVDAEENILLKIRVMDTSFTLYWDFLHHEKDQTYGWYVSEISNDMVDPNQFYLADSDSISSLQSEEKLLLSAQDTTGHKYIQLIDFYMSNNLFQQAEGARNELKKFESYEQMAKDLRVWINGNLSKD